MILTLFACGGGGVTERGSVAGLVLDSAGNPVRGARVFTEGSNARETITNSSGSFALLDVNAEDLVIKASISAGGTSYYGENMIRAFPNEQVSNANVTVLRTNEVATIVGAVFTTAGIRVQGARISARPTDGSIFLTSQAIANERGEYRLNGLLSGKAYQIIATNPGFSASEVLRTPNISAVQTVNFFLGNNTDPLLPKPSNFSVVAWTSPAEISRDRQMTQVYSGLKKMIDPRYKTNSSQSRLTSGGNPVEIQLFWDRIDSLQLLGFNIYRARGSDDYQYVEFMADPLGDAFLDSDPNLRDAVNYRYVVNAANSNYPNTNNSEGPDSDVAQVVPLGDLIDLGTINTGGVPTFRWQTIFGAANYTVYVFDRYPGIEVTSITNNFSNPATGNTWTYTGPVLTRGARYYYLLMAANSGDTARSLSRIGSFIAP